MPFLQNEGKHCHNTKYDRKLCPNAEYEGMLCPNAEYFYSLSWVQSVWVLNIRFQTGLWITLKESKMYQILTITFKENVVFG